MAGKKSTDKKPIESSSKKGNDKKENGGESKIRSR